MRRPPVPPAAVLAVVGVVGVWSAAHATPAARQGARRAAIAPTAQSPVTVRVSARCDGPGVDVGVSPWTASVPQGGQVQWVLDSAAHTSQITITSKRAAWPFTDAPPYRGTKSSAAAGRNMKAAQKGKRFAYNVRLVCQSGTNGPYTVVIDPDMIIR